MFSLSLSYKGTATVCSNQNTNEVPFGQCIYLLGIFKSMTVLSIAPFMCYFLDLIFRSRGIIQLRCDSLCPISIYLSKHLSIHISSSNSSESLQKRFSVTKFKKFRENGRCINIFNSCIQKIYFILLSGIQYPS